MKAIAMPFGKRGQIGVNADRDISDPFIAPLPLNYTTLEWSTFVWKTCKTCSLGQGVISLGYHASLSIALALAILFVPQDILSQFVAVMTPYWPLLSRVEPYMDARGHHELFLYLSAMYFKDAFLIVFFSLRNIVWVTIALVQMRSAISLQFRQAPRLAGLVPPVFLIYWLDQLYYGPSHVSDVLIYDGRIFLGIVGPADVGVGLVFFFFYSPLVLFIPKIEGTGGIYSRFKHIRGMQ